MNLNEISYRAIEKAVNDVLEEHEWPIREDWCDAGLTKRAYTSFVGQVVTKLRDMAAEERDSYAKALAAEYVIEDKACHCGVDGGWTLPRLPYGRGLNRQSQDKIWSLPLA